jgi:phage-related protein
MARAFSSLSPRAQKIVAIVGIVVAALGPLLVMIASIGGALVFLAASPVVLIILGLVALAAALVVAYQSSETFRDIVNKAFETTKSVVDAVVKFIVKTWDKFGDEILAVARFAVAVIRTHFTVIFTLAKFYFTAVVTVVKVAIAAIVATISAIRAFVGMVSAAWSTLVGVTRNSWNAVRNVITGILTPLLVFVRGTFNRIVDAVRGVAGNAVAAARVVGQGIRTGIVTVLSTMQGAIRAALWTPLSGAVSSVVGAVAGAARAVGRAIVDGIIAGATGLGSRLGSKLASEAKSAFNIVKDALQTGSPSKLAAKEIGLPVAQGVLAGVSGLGLDFGASLSSELRRGIGSAVPSSPVQPVGRSAGGITINVGTVIGGDRRVVAREFARLVQPELDRIVRTAT